MSHLSDDEVKEQYQRLTKAGWDRALEIAKRRKERHEKINFDNPAFIKHLQDLEDEMKERGLK